MLCNINILRESIGWLYAKIHFLHGEMDMDMDDDHNSTFYDKSIIITGRSGYIDFLIKEFSVLLQVSLRDSQISSF